MRPSTRALRIFSTLSLLSLSLFLQPSRQNAWAQGSADKNAAGLTSDSPLPMPLPASAISPSHANSAARPLFLHGAKLLNKPLVKPIKPTERQPKTTWQKKAAVPKSPQKQTGVQNAVAEEKLAASQGEVAEKKPTAGQGEGSDKAVLTSEATTKPQASTHPISKSVASKAVVSTPAVTKSVTSKPVDSKSVVTKSGVTKPVVSKAAQSKSPANFSAAPSSVTRAAKEVEKKIQDHDLASAVNIWSTEIEAHPENAESWVGRASVKRMIGDYRGAQDDLDRALELNANSVPALISRAAVRRRLADLRGAAKDIDRAVELAPRSYQAFAERSSLRFALNDMQGAMADYNYAITINPELNKQAAKYTYSANSQPQITIREARDVSKIDSNKADSNKPVSENKTIADNKFGNESKTITDTKSSGENRTIADTKSSDTSETQYTSAELAHLNNTAVHEINLKHFASAIKTFEQLLEMSPNYAHARDNLVIAHNNYGLELAVRHPEEALKQFRAALYLDPSQAAIRKNVSAIMRENGQDPSSIEDRMAIADQCLAKGEAEGAFIELSEALRIKNTQQLRDKLQVALLAINANDTKRSSHTLNTRERDKEREREHPESKLESRQETKLQAKLETKSEAKLAAKEDLNATAANSDMPPPTILGTITPALPEQRSAMTTIADLPNATLRTREPAAMRPIRDHEDRPAAATMPLESPSASPGYDAAFIKATLDNTPETVLQVARQLASENRELDAEALLNRLGDILRRRILKGDRAAEQTLENTLETLSELYIKSNRLQNAEPTLRELIAIREKTKGPDDHILGKTLAEYSNVLKSLGRSEEASKHEQKANIILNQLSAH